MKAMLKKLWKDESGIETVEVALLLALLVIVSITIITTLGTTVRTKYTTVEAAVAS